MLIGTGVDLIEVERIARSIERFGERFLRRVYTDHEIAYCSRKRINAESFAARFAAKEATLKVLRPVDAIPAWRSIEVCRQPGGWTELVLSGAAAVLAEEQGILQLSVSLSHGAGVGMATVVARCSVPTRDP